MSFSTRDCMSESFLSRSASILRWSSTRAVCADLLARLPDEVARHNEENGGRHTDQRPDDRAAPPPDLLTLADLVEGNADQSSHQLLLGDLLAVALRPRIGGDRLFPFIGQRTVQAELEAQCGRETFALRVTRLALDDQRDHAIDAAERLEAADFFVDIFALRRVRRTQHDQELRGFERGERLLGQRMSGGKILAVAEDRPQGLRHQASGRLPTNQILVDAIALERGMQPLAPRGVAVTIA